MPWEGHWSVASGACQAPQHDSLSCILLARVACFYLGLVSILAILVTITRKEAHANSRESERDFDEIGSVKEAMEKDASSSWTVGRNRQPA